MYGVDRSVATRSLPGGEAVLRLEEAEVIYPNDTRALSPTTLAFERSRFTVLLGPSGAGKSTLLRTLNGLVPLTRGRVLSAALGPLPGRGGWRAHRRTVGMVFQQHQLIGRLSALGNVLMGRLGHHSALRTLLPFTKREKEAALVALERVGLMEYALRRVDQLSGGQQQRVGIARALVQQPSVILADEPVASLDPATAERVLGLLYTICREDGLTAVVSLHQVELARRFADRIVGIAAGSVVFDDVPDCLDEAAVARIYRGSAAATQAVPLMEEVA